MRLHDLQVTISASNIADKVQNVQQQHAQVAQAQEALTIKEKSALKPHLIQETKERQNTSGIGKNNDKAREWRKPQGEKKEFLENEQGSEKSQSEKNRASYTGGNLDIKA